ncbi:hypothetical protein G5V65_11360 [Rhodobacter sp. HX-7-19]|uniref:Uncharacterized protein n=1 Tax=Paragemmobacter kunshanensis TaxID=2583234 RepID=A0A6M1U5D3_9RHOB|nr:hypothetical protein [Rhodobacter kunshanensis]NGQ91495.1 hypothetical protein [Rhodobacter kunshanensis]
MTANPFAAMLDGVQRRVIEDGGDALYHGKRTTYLPETEVLASLAAAVPADLAEAGKVLEGVTPGRVVQFHPSFCKEAEGAPFSEWDSSHDLSVIQPDGKRYRIGSMRHANDATFFQWCREGVPALIARIAAQEAQIDDAKDYAETCNSLMRKAQRDHEAAETALAASQARVAKLVAALKRWEHSGCPDCGGDCASANPPVSLCIMRETRAAITEATQ